MYHETGVTLISDAFSKEELLGCDKLQNNMNLLNTDYVNLLSDKKCFKSIGKCVSFMNECIEDDQRKWISEDCWIAVIALTNISIDSGAWMYIPYTHHSSKSLSTEQLMKAKFVDTKHKKIRDMKKKYVEMKPGDLMMIAPTVWFSKGQMSNQKNECKYLLVKFSKFKYTDY